MKRVLFAILLVAVSLLVGDVLAAEEDVESIKAEAKAAMVDAVQELVKHRIETIYRDPLVFNYAESVRPFKESIDRLADKKHLLLKKTEMVFEDEREFWVDAYIQSIKSITREQRNKILGNRRISEKALLDEMKGGLELYIKRVIEDQDIGVVLVDNFSLSIIAMTESELALIALKELYRGIPVKDPERYGTNQWLEMLRNIIDKLHYPQTYWVTDNWMLKVMIQRRLANDKP